MRQNLTKINLEAIINSFIKVDFVEKSLDEILALRTLNPNDSIQNYERSLVPLGVREKLLECWRFVDDEDQLRALKNGFGLLDGFVVIPNSVVFAARISRPPYDGYVGHLSLLTDRELLDLIRLGFRDRIFQTLDELRSPKGSLSLPPGYTLFGNIILRPTDEVDVETAA